MAVLPAGTAVLLNHSTKDKELAAVLLVQGRGEMAFPTAGSVVLLHQSTIDTGKDISVVSKG